MKKNANKKSLYGKANYDSQITTLIKIGLGVLIFLVLVYLLTAIITGEIKFTKYKYAYRPTISQLQYEEITKGQILNRDDKEYYVLLFDFEDSNSILYLYLRDSYMEKEKSFNMYTVDIKKEFNTSLVVTGDEKYKEKPTNINELKVNDDVTLLKIKNGKVTERIEFKEKVLESLRKMI